MAYQRKSPSAPPLASSSPRSYFTPEFSEVLSQAIEEEWDDRKQQQQQRPQEGRGEPVAIDGSKRMQRIRDTYVQLCHDDPVGITSSGLRALSRALLQEKEKNEQEGHRSGVAAVAPAAGVRDHHHHHQQHLALSERLVEGLQQVLRRYNHHDGEPNVRRDGYGTISRGVDATVEEHESDRTTEPDNPPPLLLTTLKDGGTDEDHVTQSGEEDLASAVAIMAWTCWGRMPLISLLANDNLMVAAAPLGTYRRQKAMARWPPVVVKNTLIDAYEQQNNNHDQFQQTPVNGGEGSVVDEAEEQAQSSTNADHQPKGQLHATSPDERDADGDANEEEEEVWAAESDPSDYAYESDLNYQQQAQELQAWANSCELDPVELSQVPAGTSWSLVAESVAALLTDLTYPKVAALSVSDWQQHRVTDHLTQLILILFVPSVSKSPILRGPHYPSEFWQHAGLQLLHVFRDATLQHMDKSGGGLLPGYLRLLQTLLQVNAARDMCSSPGEPLVAPATWAGLSCLSALCSAVLQEEGRSKYAHLKILQPAILHVCDELALLLETSSSTDVAPPLVYWTYVPLFRVLASTSGRGADAAASSTMPTSSAQTLLNSGLFRKWISLWVESPQNHAMGPPWGEIVFELCATSPALLGKYAWRFPGLAARATMAQTLPPLSQGWPEPLLDQVLWNLLGIHLAADDTIGGKVRWKTNNAAATMSSPPSKEQCQQAARNAFRALTQAVTTVLMGWKLQLEGKPEAPSQEEESEERRRRRQQQQQRVLSDFGTVVKYVAIPLVRGLFVAHIASDVGPRGQQEHRQQQFSCLRDEVRLALVGWPAIPTMAEEATPPQRIKYSHDHGSDDDDDDKEWTKVPPPHQDPQRDRHHDPETAASLNELRKDVKTLQSIVDENDAALAGAGNSSGIAGTDSALLFSSKAD